MQTAPLHNNLGLLATLALLLNCGVAQQDAFPLQSLQGTGQGVSLGWAMAVLGDVDGDGISDYTVAERGTIGASSSFYVVSSATGVTISSVAAPLSIPSWFASLLRPIGDVDGDGSADVLEAAYGLVPANSFAPLGPADIRVYKGLTGQLLYSITGNYGGPLWMAVRAVGDRDGDGVQDFAVGLSGSSSPGFEIRSGVNGSLIATIPSPGVVLDIATAPDIDGDGLPDFVLGTDLFSNLGLNASPLSAVSATGALLWNVPTLISASPIASSSVLIVADQSGDGIDDVAVTYITASGIHLATYDIMNGAPLQSTMLPTSYAVQFAEIARLPDVNGDGFDDIALSYRAPSGFLHVFSGTDLFRLYSLPTFNLPTYSLTSGGRVSAMPDLTGNGVPEVLVGSPWASPGTSPAAGQTTLLSLGPTLTSPTATTQVTDTSGLPLSTLTVNGNAGGSLHCVHVATSFPLTIGLAISPYTYSSAPFALWGTMGVPTPADSYATALGPLCFKPASLFPLSPVLFTVANTFFSDPTALVPASPGPFLVTVLPPLGFISQFTLQGIQQHGPFLARTNAVVLDVR